MSDEISLQTQLNNETARIRWAELERHFARGVVAAPWVLVQEGA